jgi:hypothetical protein
MRRIDDLSLWTGDRGDVRDLVDELGDRLRRFRG